MAKKEDGFKFMPPKPPFYMQEMRSITRFYLFMKWFKANYKELYTLYGNHIIVPNEDLKIGVNMEYGASDDKPKMKNIIDDFNRGAYD